MKFLQLTLAFSPLLILSLLLGSPSSDAAPLAGALIATKLALTPPVAYAGLITGIIGTVLGGVSVYLHLENLGSMEESGGNRKRRALNGRDQSLLHHELNVVEEFLDEVYRQDSSRCLERLVCNVAASRSKDIGLSPVQTSILQLSLKESTYGYTAKKMKESAKAGLSHSDCAVLFDSCPLDEPVMLSYIESILNTTSWVD